MCYIFQHFSESVHRAGECYITHASCDNILIYHHLSGFIPIRSNVILHCCSLFLSVFLPPSQVRYLYIMLRYVYFRRWWTWNMNFELSGFNFGKSPYFPLSFRKRFISHYHFNKYAFLLIIQGWLPCWLVLLFLNMFQRFCLIKVFYEFFFLSLLESISLHAQVFIGARLPTSKSP